MIDRKILLAHGSGGAATGDLIKELFAEAFGYDPEQPLEDAAVVDVPGPDPDAARGATLSTGHADGGPDRPASSARIALTTDSFVVTPVIFKGGDIGRLSVCGTVNDLLSRGAVPKYLTAGFILEEGLAYETLKTVVISMAETAKEAGVRIVTGDTKVIEGRGGSEPGLFINTAGVGVFPGPADVPRIAGISAANARPGDKILVSGTMGDHHAAILSERLSIDTPCQSDCAPLNGIVSALLEADIRIRTIRDITRGGLATVLKELVREIPVKKGDFFFIEAGTVHAIKAGTLILETQQNTDITYRLYDYDRLQNGKPRELHLEKCLDVIPCPYQPKKVPHAEVRAFSNGSYIRNLVTCGLFGVNLIGVTDELKICGKDVRKTFTIVSVLDGEGAITRAADSEETWQIRKGEHMILPADFGAYTLTGNLQIVTSWPE